MKKVFLFLILIFVFYNTAFAHDDFIIENNVLLRYNGTDMYVEIPSEVVVIDKMAFYNRDTVKKLILHRGVEEIRKSAFEKCDNLTEIEGIPSIIGDGAFKDCVNLKSVPHLSGALQIGDNAFYGCKALTNIELGEELTYLGSNAFYGCGITSIKIPYTLEKINSGAFANCLSLKTVEFEEYKNKSITEIGERAFMNCISLNSIYTPDTLVTIGPYAFSGSGITRAELNCKSVGEYAFSQCPNLKYLRLSDETEKVEKLAFASCTALNEKYINTDYTIVDDTAFDGCTSLGKINTPNRNEALINAYKLWINMEVE